MVLKSGAESSTYKVRTAVVMAILFLAVISCPLTRAQVPVELSTQKIVSSGRTYYIHQVKKGQTLFSISRAYNVSVEQIRSENHLTDNEIQEGQMLKIPASGNSGTGYVVSGQVVPVEQNIPGNAAGTAGNTGRQGGSRTVPIQDERYIYHHVMKGETLYSISREYGISVRDLKRANGDLLFPHEGDYLRIPRSKVVVEEQEEVTEVPAQVTVPLIIPADTVTIAEPEAEEHEIFTIPGERSVLTELRGTVNVKVLLPFFLQENSIRSFVDSTKTDSKGNRLYKEVTMPEEWIYEGSVPFLEVYEGILLAVDSLRHLGLHVKMDVFDTGADTNRLASLINSGRLDDADLIIGPAFSYTLSYLSAYAAERGIPVVSMVPLKDPDILKERPTLFRVFPSRAISQDIITRELESHPGSNILFLYPDSLMADPQTTELWNKITRRRSMVNPYDTTVITPCHFTGVIQRQDTYSNVLALDSLMRPDRENLVVLATTQTPVVVSAFSALHALSKKYNIKVIGYPEIGRLETIDLRYYYDLELFIPSVTYLDFDDPSVEHFAETFLRKFGTEPVSESFAWTGFDIAYYFIGGIASYGRDFLKDPGIFHPHLLSIDPFFSRDSRADGYENRGMFILHYKKDMTIEVKSPVNYMMEH